MKVTPREKRRHAAGREKNDLFPLSPPRVAFSRVGCLHARSRFARSTVPEEKWGTTRSLETIVIFQDVNDTEVFLFTTLFSTVLK